VSRTPTAGAADHLSLVPELDAEPPRCDCEHDRSPDGQCEEPATVRVTAVCQAEGCECAAAVYLWCFACLLVWQRRARRDGIVLRVRSL
jgi:hypothetical protein